MIVEENFYAVKCDRCHKTLSDYNDIEYHVDASAALENLYGKDWIEIDNKHYCPNCYTVHNEDDDAMPKKNFPLMLWKAKSYIENAIGYVGDNWWEETDGQLNIFEGYWKQVPTYDIIDAHITILKSIIGNDMFSITQIKNNNYHKFQIKIIL